jgi:hypothetical protein
MRYLFLLITFLFGFDSGVVYKCEATKVEVVKDKIYYLNKKEGLKKFLKSKYQVKISFTNKDMKLSNISIPYKTILPSGYSLYGNKIFGVYVNHINNTIVVVNKNLRVFYKCQ